MPATIRGRTRPTEPKPKADAYVGMMAVSLIALIAGSVFLWLDYDQYKQIKTKPDDRPIVSIPKAGGGDVPPPPAPGPGKDKGQGM
jgi:hypothetical protein